MALNSEKKNDQKLIDSIRENKHVEAEDVKEDVRDTELRLVPKSEIEAGGFIDVVVEPEVLRNLGVQVDPLYRATVDKVNAEMKATYEYRTAVQSVKTQRNNTFFQQEPDLTLRLSSSSSIFAGPNEQVPKEYVLMLRVCLECRFLLMVCKAYPECPNCKGTNMLDPSTQAVSN